MRIASLALLAAGIVSTAGAASIEEATFQKLMEEHAPALVTIKCVLKMKGGGQEQEMENENVGVMIDPKGLVMCSNSRLSGPLGLVQRLYGSSMGSFSVNPTDLKVLIGDAAEGLDAKFVARDTELDLAWVQIKEPGDKPLQFVDLSKSGHPKVGQRVISLYKMSKHYDRAAVVAEHMIGGIAKKPRDLYMAGDLSAALGLPVFAADGAVLGVSILQIPDTEEEGPAQMGMLRRMINSSEYSGAILPAADVVKATARAKEMAATQPTTDSADDDKDKTEKPAKKKPKTGDDDSGKESK